LLSSTVFAATMMAIGAQAWAGSPSVEGSWNVTFYLEPTRVSGATQCIVYTKVPGTVAGVPSSGTWTSPTFAGWSGQWIQLGDHIRWFGITGGLATTESVSFNHFSTANATTSSAGSFKMVRVASCPAGAARSAGGDPSR
jgi:hypothetical protein